MADATSERTFRLGDRVCRRVRGPIATVLWGDVIGVDLTVDSNDGRPDILIGWEDGSQSWELPVELRLAGER